MVLRFQDLLRRSVLETDQQGFRRGDQRAISQMNTGASFRQVNQLREVVEEIVDAVRPTNSASSGGAAGVDRGAGHPSRSESLIICNGYKDKLLSRTPCSAEAGEESHLVVEKIEELAESFASQGILASSR